MAKKIDYASLYYQRADGRYQTHWQEPTVDGKKGRRLTISDKDPERLYHRIQELEQSFAVHRLTFEEIAEQWKEKRWEELSYKSVEAYRAPYRRLVERFGKQAIEDVETREISGYLSELAASGYAKRTVQLHRDMMSQIYNAAIGRGEIRYNPCDHAAMPKGLPAGTRGIAPDAALEAVRAGAEKPFGLFALVCLYAGLRRGEALALRYEDIDRKAGLIHVRKSVQFAGNTPTIKAPKTAKGCRDVILLDALADAIPKTGRGYLFHGANGELLTREAYRKKWAAYCDAIGHQITAHQLRHGYASMLYEAGIADKDAQDQMGHANITLTRDVYTHVSKRQRSRTADKLNRFVSESDTEDVDQVVDQIVELMAAYDTREVLSRLVKRLNLDG